MSRRPIKRSETDSLAKFDPRKVSFIFPYCRNFFPISRNEVFLYPQILKVTIWHPLARSPKSAFLWKGSYGKPKNTKMTALATLINKF